MRTVPKWVNKIQEAEKNEYSSIRAICWSPDGHQLVVAAGSRVMVYSPNDGSLLQLLQAHKSSVYCLAYCYDGKQFASGGADKTVILWSSKMEGILKYTHNEAIQCLSYDPLTNRLCSCSISEYAIWSPGAAGVQRTKVAGRVTCCAWAPNQSVLAIGLASGTISIRDQLGEEKMSIERDGAVWAISWNLEGLLVTDWSGRLSLYDHSASKLLEDQDLGIWPVCVTSAGGVRVSGGAGGWRASRGGALLASHDADWVWTAVPSPNADMLAVGSEDGTLWCYKVIRSTVHALHGRLYATRENYTDVFIQDLSSNSHENGGAFRGVRVKCNSVVRRVAIHRKRLAVQLKANILIYVADDDFSYRLARKISCPFECSLLVATATQLLTCQESSLTRVDGGPHQVWKLPSAVRYVKVVIMDAKEVLLLGLADGQVCRVDVESGSWSMIVRTGRALRCVDVDASRTLMAAVDDAGVCRVYNLHTNRLLYQESGLSSAAFNSSCPELLCASGDGRMVIRTTPDGTVSERNSPGSVVAFHGSQVFCLHSEAINTVSAPVSRILAYYLGISDFHRAYEIACVGVTSREWARLGNAAASNLQMEIASKAYQRIGDVAALYHLHQLQERLSAGESRDVIKAEWLAGRGSLGEAARLYRVAGKDQLAMEMYADLAMFNEAQEYATGPWSAQLSRARAEWARRADQPREAATVLLQAGQVPAALAIMKDNRWTDMLLETSRRLDRPEDLSLIAETLESLEQFAYAADIYKKVGDIDKAANALAADGQWERALAVAASRPQTLQRLHAARANRLAAQGFLLQAHEAWIEGGETERAGRVLRALAAEATRRAAHSDTAHALYLLATTENSPELERMADLYYAYSALYKAAHEPFSSYQPDTLINHARFLLAQLGDEKPPSGIDMFCVWVCLAKHGSHQIARTAAIKLSAVRIPQHSQESVELLALRRRAGKATSESVESDEGHVCWRCGRRVASKACATCGHPVLYSFCSFEALPLIQFVPAEGITEEETLKLLERSGKKIGSRGDMIEEDGAQTFILHDDEDVFTRAYSMEDGPYVICERDDLLTLSPSSIVIIKRPKGNTLYYRNMMPNVPVLGCPHCFKLFYAEDYESQIAMLGHCPYCRRPPEGTKTGEETFL